MRISLQNNRITFAGLVCVLSLLSGAALFSKINTLRFHGDESGWIASGFYYANLLLQGDFDWKKWEGSQCGPWGSLNPHLGKWLIGIPLKIYHHPSGREFDKYYVFSASLAENEKQGRVPPADILLSARRTSVVFGVLCCLLIFAIGYFSGNAWIGTISASLLFSNKLFLEYAPRAMTDVHYNFFLLFLGATVILLLRFHRQADLALISAVCGLLAGLACSVKVIGIIVGGLLFLAVLGYKHLFCRFSKRALRSYLALFCFTSLAAIYLLNPCFWPSLSAVNGKAILRESRSFPKDRTIAIARREDIRKRYPQISNLARPLEFPLLFYRWKKFMGEQKASGLGGWQGNRFKTFHQNLLGKHANFFAEWVFLGIGLFACSTRLKASWRNRQIDFSAIPLLIFGVNYLFTLVFIELNWDRYYLPTVIASKLLVAVGIYEVARWSCRYLKQAKYKNEVLSKWGGNNQ